MYPSQQIQDKLEQLETTRRWGAFYDRRTPKQWMFQKAVIERLFEYLNQTRAADSPKAAVVKMPTGTGKTAIMAIVANFAYRSRNTLIVVPSKALKTQVRDYVTYGHWLRTRLRPLRIKIGRVFEPSNASVLLQALEENEANIAVCTTKTLGELYWNTALRHLYDAIQEHIDMVFVDEGHREPAKTWSRAVRSLSKPVILFTATPYRNDLRFFNIGDCRPEVTYQDALTKHECIREITFIPNVKSYTDLDPADNRPLPQTTDYVLSLFATMKKVMGSVFLDSPKIIIRCRTDIEIREVKHALEESFDPLQCGLPASTTKRNRPVVVAVHDSFRTKVEANEYENVQSAQTHASDAIFWVHQYKLMEGIDDPEFVMISFYVPYSNARSLVQQIGRVIRRPPRSRQKTAYVHSDPAYNTEDLWQGYVRYELSDKKLYGTEEIVYRIIDAFPDYFYFSNKFNRIISKEYTDDEVRSLIQRDLRVPRVTNILRGEGAHLQLDRLLESLSERLLDQDVIQVATGTTRLPNTEDEDEATIGVYLGFKIRTSDYLRDSLFFDIALVAFTFLKFREYVFYRGESLSWLRDDEAGLSPLQANEMQRLLGPRDSGNVAVKQASMVHSDPSRHTKRRRLEGGTDLNSTAPSLDEHLHILAALVCQREGTPRYIGLTRARLSDGRGTFVSVDEYVKWAKSIVQELKVNSDDHRYYGRFARHVDTPQDSVPHHLLCDMTQFKELVRNEAELDADAFQEAFDEVSQEIQNWDEQTKSARVTLRLRSDSEEIPFTLSYKNSRYRLLPATKDASEKLRELFGNQIAGDLHRNVLLRIITKEGHFYVDDHFFDPSIPLWGQNRMEALGAFYGLRELATVECEKEDASTKWSNLTTWPSNSIFSLIDKLRRRKTVEDLNAQCGDDRPFFLPEVLICDDAHGELGDFILYSKKLRRVAVVHAKQAKNSFSLSAVAFSKIAEQVVKNLRLFDPYVFGEYEVVGNLSGDWTDRQGKPRLPRLRKPNSKSISTIVSDIQGLLRTGATREVWVFYGKGFPANEFLRGVARENPDYFLKHLAYVLVNCNDAVARAGAKLRVFTSGG